VHRVYARDKFVRKIWEERELLVTVFLFLSENPRLPLRVKMNARLMLNFPYSGKKKPKSICLQSHRSRGIFRKFKLSRIALKEQGSMGNIPGLKK
jgi:small subunit ribosomal protein S14